MNHFYDQRSDWLKRDYSNYSTSKISASQFNLLAIDVPFVDIHGVFKPFTLLVVPGNMPKVILNTGQVLGFGEFDTGIICLLSSLLTNVEDEVSTLSKIEYIPDFPVKSIAMYVQTKSSKYHVVCTEENIKKYVENILNIIFTTMKTCGGIYTSKPFIKHYTLSVNDIMC